MAMQLALCVQLPNRLGGASGSACFLSTSWTLPTNRLLDMISNHPSLSPAVCGLADIHTIKTPTIPLLLHVLSNTLPAFLDSRKSLGSKPVKLLVIDAITELFHSDETVSTTTLAERSRNLTEIATLLHILANKHGLAIIVLNEVSDVIDRGTPPDSRAHEVSYRDQARLFNRADSIPGEGTKEAALGLVWANQINARIMLTRTNRTRVLDDTEYRPHKRRRTADGTQLVANASDVIAQEPTRIRRLSIIFSSVAPPTSLDYIITASGFVALDTDQNYDVVEDPSLPAHPIATPLAPLQDVCPLDLPLAITSSAGPSSDPSFPSSAAGGESSQTEAEPVILEEGLDAENGPQDEDDEWEAYWKDGDLGSDIYSQVDLEALSSGV